MIKAVLFDLDGTLADTAPDLGHALNAMRLARALPPLPSSSTRPVTSLGARGLLQVGFGIAPGHADYQSMREEFLRIYESNICRDSRLFPGMEELLEVIEARRMRWGVVTNKSEHLARMLLEKLGIASRAACIVGGDTTPHFKPHPAPLLAACDALREPAGSCVYIGDDQRDIAAGQAAGMRTAAAMWGYLNGQDPASWSADWMVGHPREILRALD